MLDAESKSGTVFSDKFGEVCDVDDVTCVIIGFLVEYANVLDCEVGRFWLDGRITNIPPPCGRWIICDPLKNEKNNISHVGGKDLNETQNGWQQFTPFDSMWLEVEAS